MKITLKCTCGAEGKFSDTKASFINTGGDTDEKGRRYVVQVDADNWLDRHKVCLENKKK